MDDVHMLATQRQDLILSRVRDGGAVRVSDLVAELDVSDMTIRRDIGELARRGLVQRVHGGVVDARRAAHEPGFRAKSERNAEEKRAIARAALALVRPGSAIALSAGTTTRELALLVAGSDVRPLTVVTNSLPAAEVLHRPDDHTLTVVLTGGTRTPSDALVGPLATHALQGLRVDVAFLGVHGMDVDAGLTTPNLLEAETDRAIIAAADRLVVLADRSKWQERGLARIARLDEVDVLVTDELPGGLDLAGLPHLEVRLAPADAPGTAQGAATPAPLAPPAPPAPPAEEQA
jgi:DeoR/GlpR family transcriptional regulator of sugar metabolism